MFTSVTARSGFTAMVCWKSIAPRSRKAGDGTPPGLVGLIGLAVVVTGPEPHGTGLHLRGLSGLGGRKKPAAVMGHVGDQVEADGQ